MSQIIELEETLIIRPDDYLLVDSLSGSTKKLKADSIQGNQVEANYGKLRIIGECLIAEEGTIND